MGLKYQPLRRRAGVAQCRSSRTVRSRCPLYVVKKPLHFLMPPAWVSLAGVGSSGAVLLPGRTSCPAYEGCGDASVGRVHL